MYSIVYFHFHWQIRFEASKTRATRILFLTEGTMHVYFYYYYAAIKIIIIIIIIIIIVITLLYMQENMWTSLSLLLVNTVKVLFFFLFA